MSNWSDWIKFVDIDMDDLEYGDNTVQFKDIGGNIIDGNIVKEEDYSDDYEITWDDLIIDKPNPIPIKIKYVRYLLPD